jgi:hypothetical protein
MVVRVAEAERAATWLKPWRIQATTARVADAIRRQNVTLH